jgi:hypothetical protein
MKLQLIELENSILLKPKSIFEKTSLSFCKKRSETSLDPATRRRMTVKRHHFKARS